MSHLTNHISLYAMAVQRTAYDSSGLAAEPE